MNPLNELNILIMKCQGIIAMAMDLKENHRQTSIQGQAEQIRKTAAEMLELHNTKKAAIIAQEVHAIWPSDLPINPAAAIESLTQ